MEWPRTGSVLDGPIHGPDQGLKVEAVSHCPAVMISGPRSVLLRWSLSGWSIELDAPPGGRRFLDLGGFHHQGPRSGRQNADLELGQQLDLGAEVQVGGVTHREGDFAVGG